MADNAGNLSSDSSDNATSQRENKSKRVYQILIHWGSNAREGEAEEGARRGDLIDLVEQVWILFMLII